MQALYKPSQYPKELYSKLKYLSPLGVEIANRWALGWPEAVQALIESNEYYLALVRQEKDERRVLAETSATHLARHEIVQEYGLSLCPPEASVTK